MAYLPLSDSLDIYVDKLLKDETGLKEYFETALKVANLLREKLDLRTSRGNIIWLLFHRACPLI